MTTLAPIETIKLTAEQYYQMGEDPPGSRLELIDGELVVSPSPTRSHSEIVVALVYLLEGHIRKQKLGKLYLDTDVRFSEDTVRRPDVAFFGIEKLARMPGERLTLPPDLCIEVLSPSNVADDRVNKFRLYESHGVGHYWIIDPQGRSVEAFSLRNGKFQSIGVGRNADRVYFPPFPDLELPLGELWAV